MCGVAGHFAYGRDAPPTDPSALERVADAIIIACMARGAPKPEGATYAAAVRATMKKGSK